MSTEAGPDTSPGAMPAAPESKPRTRVSVWAPDPLTLLGLTEALLGSFEVFVPDDRDAEADVLVFAADQVTDRVVANMRRAAAGSAAPAVLVAGELEASRLMSVVECRVVAVVSRAAATERRLGAAIAAAAAGGGVLPPNLLGELLRQVQELQRDVLAPRGLDSVGLTAREVEVVRLLAEGCDTEEIGSRLSYSERTVKNIVRAMMRNLDVRNRPQLVAHALRCGLI
ncbi:helix-turn-helix transcriptional regulator [Saccharopolyspora sp. SCSIO 74807]|uniref:helix-turn-helix transcriptional regulator n=1 Tax=Saccharopolyspora sp. SCSIO 74807 TaxID=3118084 RepID=UPI0030CA7832